MKHIVIKTALKTLLVVVMVLIVAFATASLGFPGRMATLFENMGAYSSATGYANLAYKYSDTVENLARCMDDSIFAGNDKKIVKYGDMLVEYEDFISYAEERTAALGGEVNYYYFVYSNLACAKFNCGDKDGALDMAKIAMQDVKDFPINNTYAILAIQAARNSDTEFCQKMYNLIVDLTPSAAQQNYYNVVLSILK